MILPAELAGEGLMRAVCRWTGSVVRCCVGLCLSSQVAGQRRRMRGGGVEHDAHAADP
jgi:hypothetical protein